MENNQRCKACGFIFPSEKKYAVCPACGLDKKIFEPYTEPVARNRKRLIDLHLHPIAVHFPQAMAVIIFVFAVTCLFYTGEYSFALYNAMLVMTGILLLSTPVAALAGIIDARLRFKRLNTPFIKIKIAAGAVFFILTCAIALGMYKQAGIPLIAVLSFLSLLCQAVLGQIGSRLMYAIVPGK